MLSFKVTYAIQILDMIRQSSNGMSLSDLRERFMFLPNGLVISDITKQLLISRIIYNLSSQSSRLYIRVNLNEITLSDLSQIVDDKLVLGTPVGFSYWRDSYLDAHSRIKEVETYLESQTSKILKSVTIAELFDTSKDLSRKQKEKEHISRMNLITA